MQIFTKGTCYKLTQPISRAALAALSDHPIVEPDKRQISTTGFRHPFDATNEDMAAAIPFVGKERYSLLRMVEIKRPLKAAQVKRLVNKKVAHIEELEGHKLTRKEKHGIKEDIMAEMIPKIEPEEIHTMAYVDHERDLLVINEHSHAKCEKFIHRLREALTIFPAIPLQADGPPDVVMHEWYKNNNQPPKIEIRGEAVFKDPLNLAQTVKIKAVEFDSEVVKSTLDEGMVPQEIAVDWHVNDSLIIYLVITDQMTLKTIQIRGVAADDAELAGSEADEHDEARRAVYEATALISFDAISKIFTELQQLFSAKR